jgi:hypothetical protein
MNKKNPRTNQLRQLFNYLLNLGMVTFYYFLYICLGPWILKVTRFIILVFIPVTIQGIVGAGMNCRVLLVKLYIYPQLMINIYLQ